MKQINSFIMAMRKLKMKKFAAFAATLLLPAFALAQTPSPSPSHSPPPQSAPDPRLMPDIVAALQAQLGAAQAQLQADQRSSQFLSDQGKLKEDDWQKAFAAWCGNRPACGLPSKVAQQVPMPAHPVTQSPVIPHGPMSTPGPHPSTQVGR